MPRRAWYTGLSPPKTLPTIELRAPIMISVIKRMDTIIMPMFK
jgi:hypothetical protein